MQLMTVLIVGLLGVLTDHAVDGLFIEEECTTEEPCSVEGECCRDDSYNVLAAACPDPDPEATECSSEITCETDAECEDGVEMCCECCEAPGCGKMCMPVVHFSGTCSYSYNGEACDETCVCDPHESYDYECIDDVCEIVETK